jgi:O-antigen biosynthesis protein
VLRLAISANDGVTVPTGCLWGAPRLELPETAIPVLPPAPIQPTRRRPEPEDRSDPARNPGAPLISVLMPVHDPDPRYLEEAIASVRNQTFAGWQLCLADDGSIDERVREIMRRAVDEDDRIQVTSHQPARGISAATNAALELASGEYIALVDHDDVIAADALAAIAAVLDEDPELDMVYTDEDRMSEDASERMLTFFKPGWSPELLRSAMYTCHLSVYRRALVRELGGFRSEFDGSQDYDLVLRLTERTQRVAHVPRVLYSWRIHSGSAASGAEGKPHAWEAARRALVEHLKRTGAPGTVELGPSLGWYRVHNGVSPWTPVAVVHPLQDAPRSRAEEAAFVDAIRSYALPARPATELFLAGPFHALQACAELLAAPGLGGEQIRFCETESGSHWTAAVNSAAGEADSEFLLVSPELVAVRTGDWWDQLIGIAALDGVGMAGGTVMTAGSRVASGAVVCGDGWPLQVAGGRRKYAFPFLCANFRMLAGPLVLRRELYDDLGGLDRQLGKFALEDLCLRAGQRNLRAVLCSEVTFAPVPRTSAENDPALLAAFRRRWSSLAADPFYNPNFWQGSGDFIPTDVAGR